MQMSLYSVIFADSNYKFREFNNNVGMNSLNVSWYVLNHFLSEMVVLKK